MFRKVNVENCSLTRRGSGLPVNRAKQLPPSPEQHRTGQALPGRVRAAPYNLQSGEAAVFSFGSHLIFKEREEEMS